MRRTGFKSRLKASPTIRIGVSQKILGKTARRSRNGAEDVRLFEWAEDRCPTRALGPRLSSALSGAGYSTASRFAVAVVDRLGRLTTRGR